jgi:hypothetical protein
MFYEFSPHTTANYIAKALVANGHDVRTSGATVSLEGFKVPYRLWGPHTYPVQAGEMMESHLLGDWKPDVLIWADSGETTWPMQIHASVPTVGYVMDAHNPEKMARFTEVVGAFDYKFCAQRPWCEELGAYWLPFACDPDVHTPTHCSEEYDLAWVGGPWMNHPLYTKRFETMAKLAKRYKTRFMTGVHFEDMSNVYGSARIGWHMSVTGRDLDMRVFEVMCSGRPLLMDWTSDESGIEGLFEPDTYAGYDGDDDLMLVADLMLGDPDYRSAIGTLGRECVLAAHTYRHRAHELMRVVGLE